MKDKTLKVVHIIDTLGLGGAQTIIKEVVESWEDTYTKLWVLGLRKTDIIIPITSKRVIVHDSSSKYSFGALFRLVRLIKDEQIDVIHAHLPKSMWMAFFAKRFFLPKVKLIYHEHGDVFGNESKLDFFIYKLGAKLFLKTFDRIIPVSQTTASAIEKINPKLGSKILTLHNFVDLERFTTFSSNQKKAIRRGFEFSEDPFIIGFVGRMAEPKGLPILIQALSKLEIPFTAILVGEGDLKDKIQQQVIDLNLAENVQFWGYRKDIPQIMQLFDVMVMSSLREASPMALFEAFASGVPVIANEIPMLEEYLPEEEKVGLIFKRSNHLDLAKKIKFLYDNPSEKALLGTNASFYAQSFSLSRYLVQLEKMYRNLN